MKTRAWMMVWGMIGILATQSMGQAPVITSFSGNGQLVWTNTDANLLYQIEWAASLTAPDGWHSNYFSLTDIQSLNPTATSSVPMFYRVSGTRNRVVNPASVPKTGQTTQYQAGDDGTYQKGVAWPNPRFTVQADTNCVLDNLTGLIWARNANLIVQVSWSYAITYCEGLVYGGTNDWRLPNLREMRSLIDYGQTNLALPTGHPFTGVQWNYYWTSTTAAVDPVWSAWYVHLGSGKSTIQYRSVLLDFWPVRGGQ